MEVRPFNSVEDGEEDRPNDSPLAKQVDQLGWALTNAIRDFRYKVEDIYDEHGENIEYSEAKYKLEVSSLRAENSKLREMLNLDMAPGMWQNVHFDALVAPDAKPKKIKGGEEQIWAEINGSNAVKAAKREREQHRSESGANSRPAAGEAPIVRKMDSTNCGTGGGSWEQFVAWVPSGAALRCPQPWKPLPHEAFAPGDQLFDLQGSSSKEDGESSSEDEEEGKAKWKVLEVWATTKEELAEMRSHAPLGASDKASRAAATETGDKQKLNSVVPLGAANTRTKSMLEAINSEDWAGDEQGLVHPHSRGRILWDLFSLLLVLLDIIIIPLSLFALPKNWFETATDWTTRLFWTLDIFMSVETGVVLANGEVEMELKFIMKRYLKTWWLVDAFIVGSDWTEFIFEQGGAIDFGRFAKAFRVVRAARLLRLVRMKEVLAQLTERIQSELLSFILNILKLVVALVLWAHVVACVWWGVSGIPDNDESWKHEFGYDKSSVSAQYLVSMHWTLCQFSGGMEEIRPVAIIERFFAVVYWIVAFFFAAITVSVLTSSLVQLHIIGGSQSRQMATLRKFLKQNSISSNLALRVQRSAKHALSGDLTPDAVDLLTVVSDQIRLEMHFEMYSELFRVHPFFAECVREGPQVMRRICHFATSTLLLDSGDVVFSKGEAPSEPKMIFVFRGTLEYVPPTGPSVTLGERQWIAEPVLWTKFVHRGTLTAQSDVKVARLDARKFQDIMDRFKEVFQGSFVPRVYAADFVGYLNNLEKPITDCSSPTECVTLP
eukprot:TRINITY_DN12879_c0_g2_i2.p1 TRINITY_DN12879_c0_g2~~TRINITY_DN12879_c0_g2_i2.p1  ORF type:complete len:777 (-),score=214.89 TRINITY_DN12879_c0_g2_i2:136-2466(-)